MSTQDPDPDGENVQGTIDALQLFGLEGPDDLDAFARFIDAMRRDHQGRENAIPAHVLADEFSKGTTTIRDWKQVAVKELGLPIGSSQDGYFVIQSDDELERERESLLQEAATLTQTARQLDRAYYGRPRA